MLRVRLKFNGKCCVDQTVDLYLDELVGRSIIGVREVEVGGSAENVENSGKAVVFQEYAVDGKKCLTLRVLVEPNRQERWFDIEYDEGADGVEPLSQVGLKAGLMEISSVELHGVPHYKINSNSADYYYDIQGGGFSSILDSEGNDWIGYNQGKGSSGVYRGIPNLVYPEGFFHPGCIMMNMTHFTDGPLCCILETESQNGQWACRWRIYPDYAKLEILKSPRKYWFLYEGTPGGTIDRDSQAFLSDGHCFGIGDEWKMKMPDPKWVAFRNTKESTSLLLWHIEGSKTIDSYRLMENHMTVFGFGREDLKSTLKGRNTFVIRLMDQTDYEDIKEVTGLYSFDTDCYIVCKSGEVELSQSYTYERGVWRKKRGKGIFGRFFN